MLTEWRTNWFDESPAPSGAPAAGVARTVRSRPAGGVRLGVPFKDLTTFGIGGPAAILLEPMDPESAIHAVRQSLDRGVTLRVLGNGSNLLVSDAGVDGVVLTTSRMRRCVQDGERFHVWAGMPLVGFVNYAARAGLSGVEGLIGIPAHLGGAIAMNAGGKWGEIFDVVESVTTVDLTTGAVRVLRRDECQPKYRDARLGAVVVLEATLRLTPGNSKEIQDTTKEHLIEKNSNQPVVEKSAGCIFKNPKVDKAEGRSAAKLIQDAGLKGTRIGGVEVSRKHSNYFVNLAGGTCDDALRLIDLVTEKVENEFGVRLETEVKIW